ncbi:MAG: hypothetical protein ABJA02_01795 [Acidobacteriota bacterium]
MLRLLIVILFVSASVSAQAPALSDTWKPLKFFVGAWAGTGKSELGDQKVEREYKFAVNDKFLQVTHRSVYPPSTKMPKGGVHEDLGFYSYDRTRKQFVFRQFHGEGFIIEWVLSSISADGKTIVLDSEVNENIPKDIRSRETYKILNENEFTETYEIAEPGKDLVVYWTRDFKRKRS